MSPFVRNVDYLLASVRSVIHGVNLLTGFIWQTLSCRAHICFRYNTLKSRLALVQVSVPLSMIAATLRL